MAQLQQITITGADDSVDPGDLVQMVSKFPLAEVGVLLGCGEGYSRGGPRFPSHGWVTALHQALGATLLPVRLSGHLCGELAAEFLTSVDPEVPYRHMWRRLQVNTHGKLHAVKLANLRKSLQRAHERGEQVIFQGDGVNEDVFAWAHRCLNISEANVAILFDVSHGTGALPGTWREPFPYAYCGYAGGLSPENVLEQLESINLTINRSTEHANRPVRRYWVDAETQLRSGDDLRFDLSKAEAFLREATSYTTGSRPEVIK